MRQSMKVALLGTLSMMIFNTAQANEHHHNMAMPAAESSPQQSVIHGTGVVKDIDLTNKKITISHEAIPAINWPAMTMRFTFTDLNFGNLKAGDQVNFTFIQQGNISLLQEIKNK